jgi:hypothetical protein
MVICKGFLLRRELSVDHELAPFSEVLH